MSKHQRAKKARSFNRSFQGSGAGKGDGDRTTNGEAYRANYDEIDWGHGEDKSKPNPAWVSPEGYMHNKPLRFTWFDIHGNPHTNL